MRVETTFLTWPTRDSVNLREPCGLYYHVLDPWWRHMERYSNKRAFARGIHRLPLDSSHRTCNAELWCWEYIEGWVQETEVGSNLAKGHRSGYFALVVCSQLPWYDFLYANFTHRQPTFRHRIFECFVKTPTNFTDFNIVCFNCSDVIMSAMASQITGVSIVCWSVYSGAD